MFRVIVLDTNVVSEPMRVAADARVVAWLDRQVAETLFLTATSLSGLLFGIHILPAGRRRDGLAKELGDLLDRVFGPRVLPFDREAAKLCARLAARARAAGHVISVADGQIAAIAALHGFAVATRDTPPFRATGVAVIDPWAP